MIAPEHLPRAPEARDHLIADEHRPDLLGDALHAFEESRGRYNVAVGPLHRLDDDRRDRARRLALDLLPQKVERVRSAVVLTSSPSSRSGGGIRVGQCPTFLMLEVLVVSRDSWRRSAMRMLFSKR